jgi:crossover junction endodeoxyribonuclease RuvC
MRLLALDPALRNSGFALLEKDHGPVRVLDFGVLRNPASVCMTSCLVEIHRGIVDLIDRYQPELCAVESIIFVQNSRTAVVLGAARGCALLAAAQRGLPIYEYAPKRVKQAVVGRGDAQKAQVCFMVRAMLGLDRTPGTDAADALAIGLTHLQMQATPATLVRAGRHL